MFIPIESSTGCIGVHRWGRWSLVGWVLGGNEGDRGTVERASEMMVEMEVLDEDAYGLRLGNYHYFVEQCYLFITHVVQFNRPPYCATSL